MSSVKSHRVGLQCGRELRANRALHMIAVGRLRYGRRCMDDMTRRTVEGLSRTDVIRYLERFTAREVFYGLTSDLAIM